MQKKTGFLKNPFKKSSGEKYRLIFIVAFFGMMVGFLPSLVVNKGIFLYYGDFNSQQQMFYYHAQDMVKSGNLGWDWNTDLGTSFVTSYSFYLLGSPFFWITTLFPKGATIYLIPWLLALKTAVAAVFAYAYIRRFVENPNSAFIGGILYAFSGFQAYNVFFNHFHDATAFFPLLLLGLELLVQDNKKGAFALAVAVNAITNYFFFIGDCIFLVIYFLMRCCDKEFKITLKKVGIIALESIIGVMISCIIFLPSCLAVLENYRVKERLYGLDMVLYSDKTRIPRIFQAFFMMSDMPARVNIFSSDYGRWSSVAGYLPMFSMCGVIAYMRTKKKNWANNLVYACIIFACIPILNSAFVLFNASYYARWFYSPILVMCMMTAKVVDDDPKLLKKGFIPVTVVSLAFLAVGLLPTQNGDKVEYFKIPQYIELYWIQAGVTLLMLVMLAVLVYGFVSKNKKKTVLKLASVMTAAACIICMTATVLYGVCQGEDNKNYIGHAIKGGEKINMSSLEKASKQYNKDNSFYRIDTSPNVDNWCMFWGLPSMRCFHSVVSTSIMDFYTSIGETRDVATRMETTMYPLRNLLSAKYYFKAVESKDIGMPPAEYLSDMPNFKYVDTQNGFRIYENENYVPMGFAFDNYVLQSEIKDDTAFKQSEILLKAMALDRVTAKRYGEYITKADPADMVFTNSEMEEDCSKLREQSCYSFKKDTDGFEGKINLKDKKLVFFSVPYDKGWSAKVNGKPVEIIKADYGFMAVPCESGESTVTFTYKTYGADIGLILTVAGIVSFAVYAGINLHQKRRNKNVSE